MTLAVILSILESEGKLACALIASQTPAQQAVLWDRYIEVTAPLHRLLLKIEGQPAPVVTAVVIAEAKTA